MRAVRAIASKLGIDRSMNAEEGILMSAPAGVAEGGNAYSPILSRRRRSRAQSSSGIGSVAGGIASAMTSMFAVMAMMVIFAAVGAAAASAAPELDVDANGPPVLVPGGSGTYEVTLTNIGDATMPEGSVTVTITLPDELTATSVDGTSPVWDCAIAPGGQTVTCTGPNTAVAIPSGETHVQVVRVFRALSHDG